MINTRTIIGVPGKWPSRGDIVTAIAKDSGGYLFAGMVLMHIDTTEHFTLEIYEHDDNLAKAFSLASGGRLSKQEIEQIDRHTFCLYLVGDGEALKEQRASWPLQRLFSIAEGLA